MLIIVVGDLSIFVVFASFKTMLNLHISASWVKISYEVMDGFRLISNFLFLHSLALKFIANKYMVPLEGLKKLNGHIDPESLRSTDTIFLPSTIAVTARTTIINAKKEAEFILDRCNYELTKGVGLVG